MDSVGLLAVARALWVVLAVLAVRMTHVRTQETDWSLGGENRTYFAFPLVCLVPWLILAYFLWGEATR